MGSIFAPRYGGNTKSDRGDIYPSSGNLRYSAIVLEKQEETISVSGLLCDSGSSKLKYPTARSVTRISGEGGHR